MLSHLKIANHWTDFLKFISCYSVALVWMVSVTLLMQTDTRLMQGWLEVEHVLQ